MAKKIKNENLPDICQQFNKLLKQNDVEINTKPWIMMGYRNVILYDWKSLTIGSSEKSNPVSYRIVLSDNASCFINKPLDDPFDYKNIRCTLGIMQQGIPYYKKIILQLYRAKRRRDYNNDDYYQYTIKSVTEDSSSPNWFSDYFVPDVIWADVPAILDELQSTKPHFYQYLKTLNPFNELFLTLSFPELEILKKANFSIVNSFFTSNMLYSHTTVTAIKRIFKPGTSPKNIIQMPKSYFNEMKTITNITIWDAIRKLAKTGTLNIDTLHLILENETFLKQISHVYNILQSKVFTTNQLIEYMRRIDMYEAIGIEEGLLLLQDYIRMCRQLGIHPRTDSDSLKREHDVAARLCREQRNEKIAAEMQPACDDMQKYNYSEDHFFIRGIRDYDDLLDEAKQQSNCLSCYGNSIARRKSLIYVMRETDHPDKSLISIELSPDGKTIRQKYLAHNQPIRNKAQSDFIKRWLRHINNPANTLAI